MLQRARSWLKAAADHVTVALLSAMFAAFILQIVSRYVFNHPLGWTLEACLTTWLWLVFWASAFILRDADHVKFDLAYVYVGQRTRRVFALVSAIAILAGFLAAMPATIDYITFYQIKKSSTLRIRLDYVFSVYGLFAGAIVIRYAARFWHLVRGGAPDELEGTGP
jgi:C4-dicarboxylate transporter, DctQ subunit